MRSVVSFRQSLVLLSILTFSVYPSQGFAPSARPATRRRHHQRIHQLEVSPQPDSQVASLEESSPPPERTIPTPANQQFKLPTTTLNAILLTATFGWAIWTILTIDSGMTRGWSQSEIALRIPLDNWSSYEESLAEKPVYTKTLINVVIYLLGDWLSQTVFQEKNIVDFDVGRTLRNGFIGLCFGPLVHEYYQFSDTILPPDSIVHRLEKIFMDQTVYLSVKASVYVAAVALLAGEGWQTAKENVEDRMGGIMLTAWKFWPLIHCLTYTIIPAQHRILWVNCVDLIWNAILASMSSGEKDDIAVQELSPSLLTNCTDAGPSNSTVSAMAAP